MSKKKKRIGEEKQRGRQERSLELKNSKITVLNGVLWSHAGFTFPWFLH